MRLNPRSTPALCGASILASVSLVLAATAVALTAQEKAEKTSVELKFASAKESLAEYDRTVKPFFAKHCNACHNEKKAEGDLVLDKLAPDMKDSISAGRWALLLEKLTTGEMPPESQTRPSNESLLAVTRWIQAEMKRAGRHAARRPASSNGNALAHHLLFDPKQSAPLDAPPRVRLVSPQIYWSSNNLDKAGPGLGQPFSPMGGTTFADMGSPRADESIATQLLANALALVEKQTAHKMDGDKVVPAPGSVKELVGLMDEKSPLTKQSIESAVAYQFDKVLVRRPTEKELAKFVAFAEKNVEDAGRVKGMRYVLAAVHLLPEAIYRSELGGKVDELGRVRLTPREIAFALAYALTDRRPDSALLADAEKGRLGTKEGVAAAARRMLEDGKLQKPRILRFFREYFGYEAAREVFKEPLKEFGYDAGVLIADTDALIEYVLKQDKDVLKELLTTNKSFVNVRINAGKGGKIDAYHSKNNRKTHLNYNLPADWQWTDKQPIELPKEQRAGVLTQPSWLAAQSTTFDNHAIHRGKWVRERLLGGVVPDVPITVDAQLPDAPDKTLRERMKVTQDAYCWKCHRLMNDVGLTFETFDHFGRFRTREKVVDAEATKKNVDKKGKPLGAVPREVSADASGLIAHAGVAKIEGKVGNAIEMLHRLAASEHVEQVFVRHAFRYWMGRNETLGDSASLRAAHRAYRDSGGSMNALIVALLSSDSFLYRVPSKNAKK